MNKAAKSTILLSGLAVAWFCCLWLSFDLITHSASLFFGDWTGWQKFLAWLAVCALTAALFVVTTLLLEKTYLIVLAALPALGAAMFFGVEAVILAAIFPIIFILWAKDVRQVLVETMNFRKTSLYTRFLRNFYSVICSVLAVFTYFLINSYVAANGFTVPEGWKSKVMAPISAIVVQRLEDQIKAEFESKGIPIPAEGIDQLLQTELQETLFKEGTTRQKFIPQSLNQAVEADLTNQLEEKIQQVLAPYAMWVEIGLAVVVFFTLNFFGAVVVGFGQLFLAGLFWFLVTTGFIVLKTETREVTAPSL
ncbi:MAG: hypothetical protein Q8N84_00300 [bacterium]|nr:hypothetical protein [bacterium]